MRQLGAALAYATAVLLWLALTVVYYPILQFLGVPAQPAIVAIGVGTLLVIGLVLVRTVFLPRTQ